MSTSELKMIPVKGIKVSKTNPRKTFDEKSMKELAESIKQHGILQPILIRPIPDSLDEKMNQNYELVCGERRFKAAATAKLSEVPANIRHLTDDEAFELQIIENLERKDVHPLEEAEAFKRMLDSEKYTIEDIAAKVSKSPVFITQRLKLNDLIPELKEDFHSNLLGIGHAVELARISEKQQKDIQYDANGGDFKRGYSTVSNLKERINRGLNVLSDACFDTKDEKLLKKCGSCEICPKRSGANKLLFDDVEKDDVCFDVSCYESKVMQHIENIIAQISVGEKNYLVIQGYGSYNEPPKEIQRLCKTNKINILKEWDDFDTSSAKGSKKALWVSGSKAGKFATVKLKKSKAAKEASTEEDSIEEQIQKIEDRGKRALELDNEKIEAALREKIPGFSNAFKDISNGKLSKLELKLILICLLDEMDYDASEKMEKKYNLPEYDYSKIKTLELLDKIADDNLLVDFLQTYVYHRLTSRQVSDRKGNAWSELFYQLATVHNKKDVDIIQLEQDEKAIKRIERSNMRIEKLKSEL